MLDLETLLAPCAESPPCGPNLEYDPRFAAIEQAAARVVPQEYGKDSATTGHEPEWPKVLESSVAALAASKDLRLAVYLARALMAMEGLRGLPPGLALLRGLLERYWNGVHPQLEGDDPTLRLNALAALISLNEFLGDLRGMTLIDSRVSGRIRVRDVEVALGRLPVAKGTAAVPLKELRAHIGAAQREGGTSRESLALALESLSALRDLLVEKVGAARAVDLKPLMDILQLVKKVCDEAAGGSSTEVGVDQPEATTTSAAGEVRSRDEAIRLLECACAYLDYYEPSNPAPLLIRRAQMLMRKNFVEIIEELLPDSMSTLERLAGKQRTR